MPCQRPRVAEASSSTARRRRRRTTMTPSSTIWWFGLTRLRRAAGAAGAGHVIVVTTRGWLLGTGAMLHADGQVFTSQHDSRDALWHMHGPLKPHAAYGDYKSVVRLCFLPVLPSTLALAPSHLPTRPLRGLVRSSSTSPRPSSPRQSFRGQGRARRGGRHRWGC